MVDSAPGVLSGIVSGAAVFHYEQMLLVAIRRSFWELERRAVQILRHMAEREEWLSR